MEVEKLISRILNNCDFLSTKLKNNKELQKIVYDIYNDTTDLQIEVEEIEEELTELKEEY